MKKIVGNLLYDTEKSEMIVRFEEFKYERRSAFHPVEILRVECALYRTKNGRFFKLYDIGGKNEDIRPVTEIDVKEFLINHHADIYVKLFNDVKDA